MKPTELKALLKKGEDQILEIRKEQEQLIRNYARTEYHLESGDIFLYKGMRCVVVGFDMESVTHKLRIRYKRIKYNETLDNIVYKIKFEYKLERLGKYNGKY